MFVLGIDGGQTSLKCTLADREGRIFAEGRGPGIVHLAVTDGEKRLAVSFQRAIADVWQSAGQAPQPIAAAVLGLSGVEAGTPEAETTEAIARPVLNCDRVYACSDAETALWGAHQGRAGIIVIAGTGSVVLGMDNRGNLARAGGWGWLVGDEGSACAIGRNGLNAALRAWDGVGPATALIPGFEREFAIQSLAECKRIVYQSDFGSQGFAALARIVSDAARAGDRVATDIINRASQDLAEQTSAVTQRLQLPAPNIAPVGGAFEHISGLRSRFNAAIGDRIPEASIKPPALSPSMGAVQMALQAIEEP